MSTHSAAGKTTHLNGFDMYYETYGKGAPLLLLHGFAGSSAALLPVFESFIADHQLIIPDLRGHGRSTNPLREFSFQQVALDMLALLDHLKISSCCAVGFSGGGCALLHMALQQPTRIPAMALVSATPYIPTQARELMALFPVEKRTEAEWIEMRKIHHHGDEQIRLLWNYAYEFRNSYLDLNFTPALLSQIQAKTLVIQGDRDPIYPIELSVEMYRHIPNSALWVIPNGGHVPIDADLMPVFLNQLRNFL